MMTLRELRELNPREPGNWPWPAKVGSFVLLLLAVMILAYFLLWQGQMETLEAARQEEVKLKDTVKERLKLAVNLDAYRQQKLEIEQSFGALLKQLPNRTEMDALIIDINQAGLGRGLQFDLFKPAPQENLTEFYAELPINIKVTGNYHDFGAFASDIAKLSRIVLLNDVNIQQPQQQKDSSTLTMEAVAKTYRYLDEQEVAAQRKAAREKAAKEKGGK